MKPLIGITTDHTKNRFSWGAPIYGQNRQYPDAIEMAGGVPVLLPYIEDSRSLRALYDKLDGILFSGGGDIDPSMYGEEPEAKLKDVSLERDAMERQLMQWAIEDDKPIFGICRGYQLMNVVLGGTLIQDIPSQTENMQNHDISTEKKDRWYVAHQLKVDSSSRLATIIGSEPIDANSHHHQAVKRVADQLQAVAWAEDGIIEGVELPRSRFAIGVQCHPESLVQNNRRWAKLFREFIKAASTDMTYFPAAKVRSSSSAERSAAAL